MGTETPAGRRVEGTAVSKETEDFGAAQRALFEASGLDVRSRVVDLETPRVRTRVYEAGLPTSDPPVVFVHGTAAFGAFFAPLVAHLDGIRTVAFDRPGYGLSGGFTYTEANVRGTLVDSLLGVLDELGIERADVVGHSAGGYAGILFALAHPDRVRNLVLVGAVPGFPGTRPPLPLRLFTAPLLGRVMRRMGKSGEEGVLDIAEVFGERDAIRAYPALIGAIAAHERDPKSVAAGMGEFRALFSVRGWRSSVRVGEDELEGLRCPTTVVWGERDPLGRPDDVRDAVELIPDVRFETVDAGHIPYLAHPERCARLVRETRDERATDDG